MKRREFLGASLATAVCAWGMPSPASQPSSHASAPFDKLVGPDFNGTILVARSGRKIFRHSYGIADRAFAVPSAPEDAYRIASITKLFTSVLILKLVEQGKLDLDSPIAAYIPTYKGPALNKVKISQLLNHTSGIENYDKGLTSYAQAARDGIPLYQLPHTSQDLMDRYASGPLVHEPGTTFDYNNADYVILGKIIEAIDGKPLEQVLSNKILQPVKLARTGMIEQKQIIPRLAPTYYKDENTPLQNDMPVYGQNWYAAGGMYSTVDDLHSFARALYSGALLSPGLLTKLLSPGLDEYGFGLWISDLDVNGRKHRFAQRPGRIMGANTLLLQMLNDDLTIVILANTNLVDTDKLGFSIARHLLS
jgi:D-alanyl-D-alanine carboxypeptidase